MFDTLVAEGVADAKRITGGSNGGALTYKLQSEMADGIAGIGVVTQRHLPHNTTASGCGVSRYIRCCGDFARSLLGHWAFLVLFFMFAWTQRWFLTDIPFDCFYAPLFFVSGPVVQTIAHVLEHWSEHHILPGAGVWFHGNIVPGVTCLLLGGLQWWGIENLWMWVRKKMQSGSNQASEVTVRKLVEPQG